MWTSTGGPTLDSPLVRMGHIMTSKPTTMASEVQLCP
jgi:hypothetical protein